MDPAEENLRQLLRATGGDLWSLIETAIAVAARDDAAEFRSRRDSIVEMLYSTGRTCRNCDSSLIPSNGYAPAMNTVEATRSPAISPSPERESPVAEEDDEQAIDSELSKILAIKEFLEDPDQSDEDSLVGLLQNLSAMDITYRALKETDIGRHVNAQRKHPSAEVRRLVKQIVRKWKEQVDEWVKSNSACDSSSPALLTDGDSPQKIPAKNSTPQRNSHHEWMHSPNNANSGGSSERNGPDSFEPKIKAGPRTDAPARSQPNHRSNPSPAPPPAKRKEQEENLYDPARLDSARRRLHENYQEAQNAKKQRTIQVMDIHEIPKPKNAFFRKGGTGGAHLRHR